MKYILPLVLILVIILFFGSVMLSNGQKTASSHTLPLYTYKVVTTYAHDPCAFTEGLDYRDGLLVESTGLKGNSTIRLVNLTTGRVMIERHLPDVCFGEGTTIFGDRVAQLTENSGYGFLYTRADLSPLGTFRYSTSGWGITYNGSTLVMSDGTSNLYFLDPDTFRNVRTLSVMADGKPVTNLNELEYVNGEIYANIWPTDLIARISPETGHVLGWIDLSGILSPEDRRQIGWPVIVSLQGYTSIPSPEEACANGIAYDAVRDRLFVTGKLWPTLYEIQIMPDIPA